MKIVANILKRFRALPVQTRRLLSVGIVLALVIALPLFVWAIVTQRFELRKRAASGEIPNPCAGQTNGTPCVVCPSCYYSTPKCTVPCQPGKCISNQCMLPATGRPVATPAPPNWTIQATALCKDGTPANHVTRLYAWSGDSSDLKFRQDLEKGDVPAVGTHSYSWTPPRTYAFVCWGMDDGNDTGNLKPVCSTSLQSYACKDNPYCKEPNYSTQRYNNLCTLNHSANPNLQENFCWGGIAYEWLEASPPPSGTTYKIYFQAPDSWCGGTCPNGEKGNINCDSAGSINAIDLSILLSNWCTAGGCPVGVPAGGRSPDLNGDDKINALDLSILLSNWSSK